MRILAFGSAMKDIDVVRLSDVSYVNRPSIVRGNLNCENLSFMRYLFGQ